MSQVNIKNVTELLALFDVEFINAVYSVILKRSPDDAGLAYYLGRVREGVRKEEIVFQIASSAEGRRVRANLDGLGELVRVWGRLNNPLIKVIFGKSLHGGELGRRMRKVENSLYLLNRSVTSSFSGISAAFDEQNNKINSIVASVNNVGELDTKELLSDYQLVIDSGVFDYEYYVKKYPDVVSCGIEPLEHYLTFGYLEGRCPNKYFDGNWYAATYPEVQGNPLVYYIKVGQKFGHRASIYFDANWYLANNADVRSAGVDPFCHFVNFGSKEGRKGCEVLLTDYKYLAPEEIHQFFDRLDPYKSWVAVNEIDDKSASKIRARLVECGSDAPKISIITPVYNTPADLFEKLESSVFSQIYSNWEWCLVNDASPANHVKAMLDELTAKDSRVRVIHSKINGGISTATNVAVEVASGDVIAFVDHDDLITPDCLAELAIYYSKNREADIVYSDDDKIDIEEKRFAPQFKPDWSPALLLSYMYFGHIFSVRRSLYIDLGGFRKDFDGSQDYDFALRAVEKARHIGHIPKILYHWRVVPGSTAASGDAKPESYEAGRRAVEEALIRRKNVYSEVSHPDWAKEAKVGMFSIGFPDKGPSVTIVIPTFNKVDLISTCIRSLAKTTYKNYEVLVVDNESDDRKAIDYLETLKNHKNIRVVRLGNEGKSFSYAKLMNNSVEFVSTDFVLFLNNDTEVINPRWLSQMMGYARMGDVGSVGARLYFDDNTIQHAGIVHGYHGGLVGHAFRCAPPHDWGYLGFIKTSREYSAVTAACMLTPTALFRQLDGFDSENFSVAYNDVDYGYRLVRLGYRNIYCADAELFHYEGKTRGFDDNPREIANYRRIYGDWYDRYYNVNLSLDNESFQPYPAVWVEPVSNIVNISAVTHNLNYEGAPLVFFDLIRGLKEIGFANIVVYSPVDGPLKVKFEEVGVQVKFLGDPQAGVINLDCYRNNIAYWGEQFVSDGADIVLTNTLSTFWAVNSAKIANIPSVWCQHESEPYETYFDYLAPALRCFAYAAFGQAFRVTYVAEATRKAWLPMESRHNFQIIRHAIPDGDLYGELERYTREEARFRLGIKVDDFVVLSVGTICRRKNQEDIVKAFNNLPSSIKKRTKILIVGARGEEDYTVKLEQMISEMGDDSSRVVLVGALQGATLYYAAADIFVCTSLVESAPRVLVEAMAFQLPIITTPVFGIPEMVRSNINSFFYSPGDDQSLSEYIERLIVDDLNFDKFRSNSRAVLNSLPNYSDMLGSYVDLLTQASYSSCGRLGVL